MECRVGASPQGVRLRTGAFHTVVINFGGSAWYPMAATAWEMVCSPGVTNCLEVPKAKDLPLLSKMVASARQTVLPAFMRLPSTTR